MSAATGDDLVNMIAMYRVVSNHPNSLQQKTADTLASLQDEVARLRDALDSLLDAITAEDRFHDRALTITGGTAALKWLLEAEDDARAALGAK